MEDESIVLLNRFRGGDADAAEDLFHRYVDRLVALASSRLSTRVARRVDAEDVVQSVYGSFFERARAGQYALERSGDLWRLLAGITVNKVLGQVERHQQQKRDFKREQPLTVGAVHDADSRALELMAGTPGPDEAVIVMDELEQVMQQLNPTQRRVLELRLAGESIEEIADEISRSHRTVRRLLERLRQLLEDRLSARSSGDSRLPANRQTS